jgi:hypothetical protein
MVWTLVYSPAVGMQANHLRAEIELPREHWRFGKVVKPDDSSLRVSGKIERGKSGSPSVDILVLTISATRRQEPVPAGRVAHVTLVSQKEGPLVPVVRRFTTAPETSAGSQQTPLEPPPSDPPPNPAAGCFFFSH